jgi:DNA topoisomerase-3
LIIATDAGREGELVARWIMEEAGWKGKTERLWISSQTDAAIKEGFANLKDGDGFLDLFHAAESRSAADWYVGMNVSRALTCRFDARMSAGRVQTPTLKILCDREEEIEKFEGSFYWTLKGDFDSFQASLYPTEDSVRITEENEARRLMKELEGKAGKVTKIDHQERREAPPLAYDLTELQRDANTGLGFSAKKTLDVLQRLYEVHKIVTYPRTDSRYLTHDIVPTFPDRLLALSNTELGPAAIKLLHGKVREDLSRLIQDDKVSDHHALLPTEQKVDLSRFSEDEKALWKLVAVRFLEVLLPDYVYVTTTAEITVGGYRFVARSTDPVALGWKQVSSNTKDEHNEDGMLAKLAEGDAVQLGKLKLR